MGHVITLPCTVKVKRNETILDPRKDFRYLIEEYMGYDAAQLFDEILSEVEEEVDEMYASGKRTPEGFDDYESIADAYCNELVSTMNALKEQLDKPRLNRKAIEEIYNNLNMNL